MEKRSTVLNKAPVTAPGLQNSLFYLPHPGSLAQLSGHWPLRGRCRGPTEALSLPGGFSVLAPAFTKLERGRLLTSRKVFLEEEPSETGWVAPWSARATVTYNRLGGINNRFISAEFWGLELQDQGVGSLGFSRGLSPWLTDGHLLTASSHGLPSVCAHPWCLCESKCSLSVRTPVRLD